MSENRVSIKTSSIQLKHDRFIYVSIWYGFGFSGCICIVRLENLHHKKTGFEYLIPTQKSGNLIR